MSVYPTIVYIYNRLCHVVLLYDSLPPADFSLCCILCALYSCSICRAQYDSVANNVFSLTLTDGLFYGPYGGWWSYWEPPAIAGLWIDCGQGEQGIGENVWNPQVSVYSGPSVHMYSDIGVGEKS